IAGRAAHALALPPLPIALSSQWGEGRGEGQPHTPEQAAASHPNPLPAPSAGARGEGIHPGRADGEHRTAADQLAAARRLLDEAVEGLRRAGHEQYLRNGLLARAAFRIDAHRAGVADGDLAGAEQDLTETHEIAARGGMRLHLTDYQLTSGQLVLAHDPALAHPDSRRYAEDCWTAARDLVAATGYHRRDPDLAALRAAIDGA
ncbi:MAG: hypothetical protein AB7F78_15830, partial [Hyphomicrobiaceae bacterium]